MNQDTYQTILNKLERELHHAQENQMVWGSLRYQEIAHAYKKAIQIVKETKEEKG